MDDILHNTPDVSILLGEINVSQSCRRLVVVRVRLENPTRLSLVSDDSLGVSARLHLGCFEREATYTHC